jgi:hypothetical protein
MPEPGQGTRPAELFCIYSRMSDAMLIVGGGLVFAAGVIGQS